MSRYKITDQHGINFITITVVDWVDVFIRKQYKDILVESLKYCQREKGLEIFAFVIMSSHVHLVLRASSSIPLSDILRDFKKFTAKQILFEIKNSGFESRKEWLLHRFAYRGQQCVDEREYQFWQSDNHPIEIYNLHVALQKIRYIHNNPIKEGWVSSPEQYLYSSASNYVNMGGILDVVIIEPPVSWVGYVPVFRI